MKASQCDWPTVRLTNCQLPFFATLDCRLDGLQSGTEHDYCFQQSGKGQCSTPQVQQYITHIRSRTW